MTEANDPGVFARANDSMADARRVVDDATQEVAAATRAFGRMVDRPTAGVQGLVVDLTRRAPFTMLGVAFVLGVLFSGGRRG